MARRPYTEDPQAMFNNPKLCDVYVRVLPEENCKVRAVRQLPCGDDGKECEVEESEGPSSEYKSFEPQGCAFRVVSAVVRSESEFFEAFTSWTDNGTFSRKVEIRLPTSKFAACEILLRFMHDKQLPTLTFNALITLIELADQFLARRCLSEVCGKLSEYDFEKTSVSEAVEVLMLGSRPTLMLQPAMRLVKEKALFVILGKYGDLELVAQEKELLSSFLSLPRLVVVDLLGHEETMSLNENTVFYLATLWLHHNYKDSPLSNEEYYRAAMEIGNMIRFPMMSVNYIFHWVPQVKWIKDFQPMSKFWLREATCHKILKESTPSDRIERRFLPRRKVSNGNELVWKIHTSRLRQSHEFMDESEFKFFGGYLFQIGVSNDTKSGSDDSFLSTGFCVHPPWPSLSASNTTLSRGECLQVQCSCKLSVNKFSLDLLPREKHSNEMWDIGLWYEWPNYFGESTQKVLRDQSPYVDSEGNLEFIMTVDDVQ